MTVVSVGAQLPEIRVRVTSTRPRSRPGKVVPMQSRTDPAELTELIARVAAGDQDAFAQFYDRTSRVVYGIVLHVLRDAAQAEEVTQEVYVDAWRTATRYDAAAGSPKAWLNTIAHRRAVDRVRSSERRSQRERRAFLDSRDDTVARDASDIAIARDESSRVRSALEALPESQRDAVVLAYFDGRSHRDISESLHVPLGTVKTRIRDGLKRLRATLGEAPS
jgi:RNA polymerase sigma-70 factor (ECF subfamily)